VWDNRTEKRLRKTFPTKTAAKLWRQDAIVAMRRGDLSAERGPALTEVVDAWLEAARDGRICNRSGDPYKPSAIRGYEQNLRLRVLPRLGHLRLREITPRDVQTLVDRLVEQGLEPPTIDSALTPLRAIFRRAVARGDATINPTRGIEKPAVRPKPRRFASPADVCALLAALDRSERPLWATAFYAGLRRGELIGLRWEDVNLADGVIHVRRGWDAIEGEIAPKSRQGKRKVPIPAALRDHLAELRMDGDGEGRVFASDRWVRSIAEAAGERWVQRGLLRLTLHEARHTYASLMIAANVNAKALSTFMGHANIGITLDLYGHLMPGSEGEAADLLDAYLAREVGGATVAHTVAHPERVAA
jgi:integrase